MSQSVRMSTESTVDDQRPGAGLAAGIGAYSAWGLLVLYWPLLEPAGATEILAHRIVWSLVFTLGILAVLRNWRWIGVMRRDRKMLATLMVAGGLVGLNWGCYVWAVNSGHVIEASLGYYINPLLSAALGVLVLGERLHPAQWAALALASAGVLWLIAGSDKAPWIALALAGTFALYGLAKKRARAGVWESLAVESATMTVPAMVFLVALGSAGHFGHRVDDSLLLASTGPATAVPLLLFAVAVGRIPLATVGMLQFVTPTLQFLIGVFGFHEQIGATGLGPYCLVWAGVLVFLYGDRRARKN